MIIKSPVCYDFSHWRTIPNFSLLNPFPFLVITKATESLSYVDPTFVPYFADMRRNNIHRGAFHFHRKDYNPKLQAQHFCNAIRAHITSKDILVLDVEEGGETAAQLKEWFEEVRRQFPDNLLILYSRRNILDPIPMTQAQRDFFKQIPTWVAGYPSNPDLYSEVPNFYIPDPTKWGEVWLWQYTSKGIISGVKEGSGDCNWVSPKLESILKGSPPPTNGGNMYFELKPAGSYTVSIRQSHPDAHILGTKIGQINNGSIGEALVKYDYEADKYVSGILRARAGDIWWNVYKANGTQISGWAAEVHLGVRYLNSTQIGEPPPPVPDEKTVTVNVDLEGYQPVTLSGTLRPK